MRFPAMWHFDTCRLRQACAAPFSLRNLKCCLISSLTVIEYSSDKQRLWSDCTYAQPGLKRCWSHIPHCWKSHVMAHLCYWLPNFHINPLRTGNPINRYFCKQGLHLFKIKTVFRDINTSYFRNCNLWPFKSQNGLSHTYCINMFGKIHQNARVKKW